MLRRAPVFILVLAGATLFFPSMQESGAETGADADKTALAVETLLRLPKVDLEMNPKLKETVLRVLERTRGTARFVKLVQKFQLTGQDAGLLEVALAEPAGESGAEAVRLLLGGDGSALIRQTLSGTNSLTTAKLAEALGNTGDKRAAPYLQELVTSTKLDPTARKQTVRALARTAEGAGALIRLAREDKLPADLRWTAATELQQARWPAVRAEAANVLPLPRSQGAQPLPPVGELVQRTGDPVNGGRIFTNASPGCINCHVVRGRGAEVGPDLSEIGTKLGKDALYEAILNPSAGISFGFEAFSFTLQSGDEAYGIIASETAEEIVLKAAGGVVTRLKKSEVTSRQPSKLSLMPADLQAAMTPQELVDLVEFLASLKKR